MIMTRVDPGRMTVIDLGRRVSAAFFALLVLGCCYLAPRFWEQSHPPLDATTLAIPREAQASWLAAGRVPKIEELAGSTMARDALLDLNTLSRLNGVPVAGWAPAWQYVWPRDAAFAASAFGRTGHFDDAERILQFLQDSQPTSGTFEARYRPDGSGPPDQRGIQLDGSGWAIWALDQVASELPTASLRRELITGFQPLLDRSVAAIRHSVRDGSTLPPPSPDYWERPGRRVTLATCSVLLAGLRSAERLYQAIGQRRPALASAADRFEQTVLTTFSPDGFPRHPGGPPKSVDLGVAFLLRPFAGVTDPSAVQAWRRSPTFMRRPAGGLEAQRQPGVDEALVESFDRPQVVGRQRHAEPADRRLETRVQPRDLRRLAAALDAFEHQQAPAHLAHPSVMMGLALPFRIPSTIQSFTRIMTLSKFSCATMRR